jgi:hypothetical protein
MWQVKNSSAATKRSKTASGKKESVEYCYQEWVAPTQWLVKSAEGSVPYRNPKKES